MSFEPDPKFSRAVRDDSVIIANSRNMDASRSGTIRDGSIVIANLRNMMLLEKELSGMMTVLLTGSKGQGCLPNWGLSGMMVVLRSGLKSRDASRTRGYQG